MRVEINKYIVADSKICHGQLTFNGTRVMVWQILEMVEGGMSSDEIIKDYPSLTKEHIKAALRYAADLTRGSDDVTVKIPLRA
ncbi:DUF433 domain-containing protein [Candidatus Woesearchaeota archaeon]|nr:DUF433 domain-containing protein [Candidatus Woesearchaeota archaeon]MBI2661433.1 DUF433 domain-containing protein [Candidatus Woesearchaeota archaeon]